MVLIQSAKRSGNQGATLSSTIVLRDLIPSRLVLVEVVLSIETAMSAYGAIQRKPGADCW